MTTRVESENTKDKNILICCTYCRHNSDPDVLIDYMQDILSNDAIESKQTFILGDFYINLLNYDSNTPTTNFFNLFLSQHCLPYIVHHASVSAHSTAIINNILSNVCNVDTIGGKVLTQVSDHFPQFIVIKKAGIRMKSVSYYQHDYSSFKQGTFLCGKSQI